MNCCCSLPSINPNACTNCPNNETKFKMPDIFNNGFLGVQYYDYSKENRIKTLEIQVQNFKDMLEHLTKEIDTLKKGG